MKKISTTLALFLGILLMPTTPSQAKTIKFHNCSEIDLVVGTFNNNDIIKLFSYDATGNLSFGQAANSSCATSTCYASIQYAGGFEFATLSNISSDHVYFYIGGQDQFYSIGSNDLVTRSEDISCDTFCSVYTCLDQ